METLKFKTNIKCTGCIAVITPALNKVAGENNWKVSLEDPQKTLSISADVNSQDIIQALKEAGYTAEEV